MSVHRKNINRAYIGLGGNVGNVIKNIQSALGLFNKHNQIELLALSSVYKTPPWGNENQDWFLNACASIDTTLTAHELLSVCLDTEITLKRVRNERWGPRTIDMDVLMFGNQQIKDEKLEIPHPRMHERAFVLIPLKDIAPDIMLKGKTIQKWTELIDASGIERIHEKLEL